MADDYSKLKVTELRDLLKERGIPSTGLSRKQQIVEALEKWDGEQGDDAVAAGGKTDKAEEGQTEAAQAIEQVEDVTAQTDAKSLAEAKTEDAIAEVIFVEEDAAVDAAEKTPESIKPATVEASSAQEAELARTTPSPTSDNTDPIAASLPASTESASEQPPSLSTPKAPSPAAESVSSDTRKRKRRSLTPPLSAESVNKRLRAADESAIPLAKLPEDAKDIVADAPAAIDGVEERVVVNGVSDDVATIETAADGSDLEGEQRDSRSAATQATDPTIAMESTATDSDGPPSQHPPTNTLYIRNLTRPLQPSNLRSYLVALATPSEIPGSEDILTLLHLDTLRTHAFAVFTSVSAAVRVRRALHGTVWPEEPVRKELWVDFVPESKVADWIRIEEESAAAGGRRDAKRWEVIYTAAPTEGDSVGVQLREVGLGGSESAVGPGTMLTAGNGMGMPNAPLGPRSDRPQAQATITTTTAKPITKSISSLPVAQPEQPSFATLSQHFSRTTAKPSLYYLPQPPEMARQRLEALAEATSRSWVAEKEGGSFGDGKAGEVVRRYTFEDGAKLVDGGADIGNFGRPQGVGFGRDRGGGGGGYRGGRW